MGLLDKLRAAVSGTPSTEGPGRGPQPGGSRPAAQDPDEAAVARYRYMLRTAPPETIEQAHAEAFAKLTPAQRQKVLEDVGQDLPPAERAQSDDPQSLARMATRAEMRQPGTMERSLAGGPGGRGGGMGMGGMIAGTLLASVAGAFIGSAIADAFLDDNPMPEDVAAEDPGMGDDPGAGDPGPDGGGFDDGGFGGDMGGDMDF